MRRAAAAFAVYLLLAIATTWPLARGLARDVPWDLGDPLLVMWILAWDCQRILGILGGDLSQFSGFFDANIFHPVPLTLAYSEHLIAQAVQALPVYAITGNIILSYNVVFLATWALSGLGMYLLVRELTGSAIAGFVAGLMYGFAPYRVPQSGHLHVLSSQWMPFVLFGLRRYFVSRSRVPLIGAGISLALQSLSSGYYLLFFGPMAAGFALWELWGRGLWRDWRVWRDLTILGGAVAAVVVPFLLPYAALREQFSASRPIAEVTTYSADVYSYLTAFVGQRVWGQTLRLFPKPEGDLFPGLLPVILAIVGLAAAWPSKQLATDRGARRWLAWFLAIAGGAHLLAAAIAVTQRRVVLNAGWFVLRISNVDQMLLRGALAVALLLVVSPAARSRVQSFMRARGFFVFGLVASVWLSLGPAPEAFGRPVEIASPYLFLYNYIPAFDGLRVPARLAMVGVLMLSVLAGYGAQAVARRRGGVAALGLVCVLFLLEATSLPFGLNGVAPLRDVATPEARVYPASQAPAVYREVARRPEVTVLVELPLGPPDYDVRAVYYSTVHWRPIVNGYSGFFPPYYGRLITALSEIPRHPDVSLAALDASGATHAIVHEGAYLAGEGKATSALLRDAGAVEVFRDGGDVLFRLPG